MTKDAHTCRNHDDNYVIRGSLATHAWFQYYYQSLEKLQFIRELLLIMHQNVK
jgi:hypothetical protein